MSSGIGGAGTSESHNAPAAMESSVSTVSETNASAAC